MLLCHFSALEKQRRVNDIALAARLETAINVCDHLCAARFVVHWAVVLFTCVASVWGHITSKKIRKPACFSVEYTRSWCGFIKSIFFVWVSMQYFLLFFDQNSVHAHTHTFCKASTHDAFKKSSYSLFSPHKCIGLLLYTGMKCSHFQTWVCVFLQKMLKAFGIFENNSCICRFLKAFAMKYIYIYTTAETSQKFAC